VTKDNRLEPRGDASGSDCPTSSALYSLLCFCERAPGIQKSGPDNLIWNKLFVGAARGVVPVSS
jgi:hypothetical protein